MGLSTELISQFAKITNDQKKSRIDEATLYGEVVQCDDSICVRFDGSEQLTRSPPSPRRTRTATSQISKYGAASVKTGDRVSVSLKESFSHHYWQLCLILRWGAPEVVTTSRILFS